MTETAPSQDSPQPASDLEVEIPNEPQTAAGERGVVESHTSLEKVVSVALDSANVANRSASVAAASTENLMNAVGEISAITKRARTMSVIVLSISALLLIASAGAFFTVSIQLNSRLKQVNGMLVAVGKRSVELGENIEKLQRVDTLVAELEIQQGGDKIEKIGGKIDAVMTEMKMQASAAATAKPTKAIEPSTQALSTQIRALEAQSQSQSRQIAKLADQVQATRTDLAKVPGLVRGVESLVSGLNEKSRVPAPAGPVVAATVQREREIKADAKGKDFIQYRALQLNATDKPH
jgi:hypothetical protein